MYELKPLCLIVLAGVIISCKTELNNSNQTDSSSVLKTDTAKTVNVKQDTATISNEPKYPVDYSGTYLLTINDKRYQNAYSKHKLVLTQNKDSLSGTYVSNYYILPSKQVVATYKGNVSGVGSQDLSPNAFTILMIDVYETTIDSVNLNESTKFAVSNLNYNPLSLGIRFSKLKNTIENNYAGGEWDTWEKVK